MTLPKDFETYTRALMGDELYDTLCRGLASEPPVSIRLNPFKTMTHKGMATAMVENCEATRVGWNADGMYLPRRPNFTFDPLFHAGLYYVQEASSMFVGHVLRQLVDKPVAMLDLCAAPGGKTTAARAALPEGSVLVANEPVKARASILLENMLKFGHQDVMVTNNYPRDYKQSGLKFDVVLTDVPCSGEGMFRKDEGAIAEWSVENVGKCRDLQRSIVQDIWPCLNEGGLLIYSTCTFNTRENEENAEWIAKTLDADWIEIATAPEWNIAGAIGCPEPMYRFIPGKTKGEGLFVAALRKHGERSATLEIPEKGNGKNSHKNKRDKRTGPPRRAAESLAGKWIVGDFATMESNEGLVAIPNRWLALYDHAMKTLRVLHAGVTLGKRKGHDIIPDISLALSTKLNNEAFASVETDWATTVRFLRKESITLPPSAPRGFVLIKFKGHPIGFVKNIGTRANNLYPQEWKIKTSHIPETPIQVLPIEISRSRQYED